MSNSNKPGLSVLIPVYNRDSSLLLSDICSQGAGLGIGFELIVADDCSTDTALKQAVAAAAAGLDNCRYIALNRNLGRAAIRNFLADNAVYDKLLFIDCDAAVISPDFLHDYIEASALAQVVCGGARHSDTMPAPGLELRWKYEKRADRSRSAACRSKHPYAQFTPFSFLIDKDSFNRIRFNENFHGYGNEDVLFGLDLERQGVSILHIDNQLLHTGIEDSATFLNKTDAAIVNLAAHKNEIAAGSRLLNTWSGLERLHLTWIIRLTASTSLHCIVRNLTGPHPSLKLFSLYKLCKLSQTQSN